MAKRVRSWRLKAALAAMLLLTLLAGVETVARLWLVYGKKLPAGRPDAVALAYYPELRDPLVNAIGPGDGHYDVLILAGSVFFDYYGTPAYHLQKALEDRGFANVRIWNMGRPAHGTRDSLIKYRWLKDKRFDWVVTYHAINDLRANNVPANEFRPDYAHMAWYAEVNRVAERPRRWLGAALAGPVFWDYLRFLGHSALGGHYWAVFDESPSDEAAAYGSEIKTAGPFAKNIEEIVKMARHRREPLTLATYASYLDPGYTKQKLEHDRQFAIDQTTGTLQLGYAHPPYADFAMTCEIWGRPENLVKGIAAHNAQTRRIAREGGVDLADLAAQVPPEGKEFIDFCHLSPAGIQLLTRALAAHAPKQEEPEARSQKPGVKGQE